MPLVAPRLRTGQLAFTGLLAAVVLGVSVYFLHDTSRSERPLEPFFDGLGNHSRKITTDSPSPSVISIRAWPSCTDLITRKPPGRLRRPPPATPTAPWPIGVSPSPTGMRSPTRKPMNPWRKPRSKPGKGAGSGGRSGPRRAGPGRSPFPPLCRSPARRPQAARPRLRRRHA